MGSSLYSTHLNQCGRQLQFQGRRNPSSRLSHTRCSSSALARAPLSQLVNGGSHAAADLRGYSQRLQQIPTVWARHSAGCVSSNAGGVHSLAKQPSAIPRVCGNDSITDTAFPRNEIRMQGRIKVSLTPSPALLGPRKIEI
jgi:hypothetical protein